MEVGQHQKSDFIFLDSGTVLDAENIKTEVDSADSMEAPEPVQVCFTIISTSRLYIEPQYIRGEA